MKKEIYEITYHCGHSAIVELSGTDVSKKIEYLERNQICPECFIRKNGFVLYKKERFVLNYELPELNGTTGDVDSATLIRNQIINGAVGATFYQQKETAIKFIKGLNEILVNEDARYWINSQECDLENLLISGYRMASNPELDEKQQYVICNAILPKLTGEKSKTYYAAGNIRMNCLQQIAMENPGSLGVLLKKDCNVLSQKICSDPCFWLESKDFLQHIESISDLNGFITKKNKQLEILEFEEQGRRARQMEFRRREEEERRNRHKAIKEYNDQPAITEWLYSEDELIELENKSTIYMDPNSKDSQGKFVLRLNSVDFLYLPVRRPFTNSDYDVTLQEAFCRYLVINHQKYFIESDIEALLRIYCKDEKGAEDNAVSLLKRTGVLDEKCEIRLIAPDLPNYVHGTESRDSERLGSVLWLEYRVVRQVLRNHMKAKKAYSEVDFEESGWTPELVYLYEKIVGKLVSQCDMADYVQKFELAKRAPVKVNDSLPARMGRLKALNRYLDREKEKLSYYDQILQEESIVKDFIADLILQIPQEPDMSGFKRCSKIGALTPLHANISREAFELMIKNFSFGMQDSRFFNYWESLSSQPMTFFAYDDYLPYLRFCEPSIQTAFDTYRVKREASLKKITDYETEMDSLSEYVN